MEIDGKELMLLLDKLECIRIKMRWKNIDIIGSLEFRIMDVKVELCMKLFYENVDVLENGVWKIIILRLIKFWFWKVLWFIMYI